MIIKMNSTKCKRKAVQRNKKALKECNRSRLWNYLNSQYTYLELSQTSMMELFWGSSYRLYAVDYFLPKSSIIEVWQGSKYASLVSIYLLEVSKALCYQKKFSFSTDNFSMISFEVLGFPTPKKLFPQFLHI